MLSEDPSIRPASEHPPTAKDALNAEVVAGEFSVKVRIDAGIEKVIILIKFN